MRLIFRPMPRLGYELTFGTSMSVGDSGPPGERGMGRSGKGREMFLLAPILLAANEFSEFRERGRSAYVASTVREQLMWNERSGEGRGDSCCVSVLILILGREWEDDGRRCRRGSAEELRRRGRISPKVEEPGDGRSDSSEGREWLSRLEWPSRLGGELLGEGCRWCELDEARGR